MSEYLMPIRSVFEMVANSENSIALRESQYVWSLFEVAHVISMCLFAGLIIMMDLRLLGIGNMQTPFSQLQKRMFPWQMLGMTLSSITGLVLVYGDPMRFYSNIFFWMKMTLMVIAAVNAIAFHFIGYFDVANWDNKVPPYGAKLAGALGLALWGFVIIAGRLIPYKLVPIRRPPVMLQPYFQWMNDSWVAKSISESLWIYPLDQAIHLVFLALFAGSILILDIRLLGFGMREQSVAKIARDSFPWVIVGFLGLVATGIPQLVQNAMREYYSEFFWIKMYVLPVALIYTFTVRRMVSQADDGRVSPGVQKIVGLVSILLWIGGVAVPSRLIGLFT